MKRLKLSQKAKAALTSVDETFFTHHWSQLALSIMNKSPYLGEIEYIDEILELIIPRFLDLLEEHPLLRNIDIKSLYYHSYDFTDKGLNNKMKIYNLAEAAVEMKVSEKFLRKGLNMGYFVGKKVKNKWHISQLEVGLNFSLLPYLS